MAAARPLSENLRPASFRGVAFQVEDTGGTAGRRTQVHEYPQRDKPWPEDLGRATRDLSFEGFVVGTDYIDQAKKLIGALEEKGPGTLVHPWFGTLQVSVKDDARYSFSSALGVARFSMSFVEYGDLDFPSAGDSTQASSRLAADNLQTSALDSFAESFMIDGYQDFVGDLAEHSLSSMVDVIAGGGMPGFSDIPDFGSMVGMPSLGGYGIRIPGLDVLGYGQNALSSLTSALSLLHSPMALGSQIASFLGISSLVSTGLGWVGLVRSLVRLVGVPGLGSPSAPTIYTPSRQQAYMNAVAVNSLARQLLLVQAVGASSLVGTSADTTPRLAHDDLMAVRNDLAAALDAESLTAPDAVYQALQDARGAVWKDLTTRSRDSDRLATISPPDTTPSLVLAYDYYEDAARDGDIVARNGIRHPGFVPPEPLKVLTR